MRAMRATYLVFRCAEVVAGGAAFAAMHQFEKHEENQGQQVNHGFAKVTSAHHQRIPCEQSCMSHPLRTVMHVLQLSPCET